MFKFIHAADIHLDSPLLNLEQYEGAPADSLRVATREAFGNVVRIAIEEQVQFVLIAGDLYDKDSPDFNTPRHVRKKFRELQEHGIRVFIIQGNHDAESTSKRAFSALTFPENVHVFSTRRPETQRLDEWGVAIHGQGFASRAVDEDLSAGYPDPIPGCFNIGLLHTNLGGNESHDNYAPSTTEGLRRKDYQYWALGHIHKGREVMGGPKSQIRYSGNTQGRHIREEGAKGCLLVSVTDEHLISVRFAPTDVWRWQRCEIDAAQANTPEAILDAVRREIQTRLSEADDRSLIVRVVIKGATPAHRPLVGYLDHYRSELQRLTFDTFEDRVWIEKLKIRTTDCLSSESGNPSMHGELVEAIQGVIPDGETIAPLRDDLEKVLGAIPADPRLREFQLDLDDTATVQELIHDAQEFLTAKLLSTGRSEEAREA